VGSADAFTSSNDALESDEVDVAVVEEVDAEGWAWGGGGAGGAGGVDVWSWWWGGPSSAAGDAGCWSDIALLMVTLSASGSGLPVGEASGVWSIAE